MCILLSCFHAPSGHIYDPHFVPILWSAKFTHHLSQLGGTMKVGPSHKNFPSSSLNGSKHFSAFMAICMVTVFFTKVFMIALKIPR